MVSTGYILSNVVLPMTAFFTERFGRRNYLRPKIHSPSLTWLTGAMSTRGGSLATIHASEWAIPTDEELLIARDTWRVVTGADVQY